MILKDFDSLAQRFRPVIVAARRSPIARAQSRLSKLECDQLMAPVLGAVLSDALARDLNPQQLILGNATGPGGNLARYCLLSAGLDASIPALSLDAQCLSGMAAIDLAAAQIASGQSSFVLAGGLESVSTAPWRLRRPRLKTDLPKVYDRAPFAPSSMGDPDMGPAAESVAQRWGIDRASQDFYALRSHERLRLNPFFKEIVPVSGVDEDERVRRPMTLEYLSRLRPLYGKSVTCANICPLSDGAALVAVMSQGLALELGHSFGLEILASASLGYDPNYPGMAVAFAALKLLKSLSLELDRLEIIDINEAFAAQILAVAKEMDLDWRRINRAGGALALGHPFGASGAVVVTRIFSQFFRNPSTPADSGTLALAGIASGGGLGLALLLRVWRE